MKITILLILLLNITIYCQEEPQQNPKEQKEHVENHVDDEQAKNNEKGSEEEKTADEKDVPNDKQDKKVTQDPKSDGQENNQQTTNDQEQKSDGQENNQQNNQENNQQTNDQEQKSDANKTSENVKQNKRQSITIIGKLIKTKPLTMKKPSEYALEDDMLYKSTDYYVGNLNIHSTKKRDLAHLEGKVVMVQGYLEKDLTKILEVIGECPEDYGEEESNQQIRDDWVSEESGFEVGRSSTEKLQKVSYVRYYKIQQCKGFRAKKYLDSKKVEIIFRNDLRKSISDLKLVAHYESVFGKPVPMYQDKRIASLSPGEKASFVIPMTISSIKKYRLHAVKAHAHNGALHIDINEHIVEE